MHSTQRGCIDAWTGKRTVQINPGHDVHYQKHPTYIWWICRYVVEMEIVMPAAMTVAESHDIALELQHKVQSSRLPVTGQTQRVQGQHLRCTTYQTRSQRSHALLKIHNGPINCSSSEISVVHSQTAG